MNNTNSHIKPETLTNRSVMKCKVDNQYYQSKSLYTFTQFKEIEALYRRRSNLTSNQMEVLSIIVNQYNSCGCGVSCYYISTRLNCTSKGEIRNVYAKLVRLIDIGYLEIYSKNKGCNIYVPTSKALKELSELVK